jgi:hypothetical protein
MSSAFDIPARKFDFQADLEFGKQSEKDISGFLDDLSDGAFEVKTDRYRNGRMVVETDQNPRGMRDEDGQRVWTKSGINVTEAKWWVYVFSPAQGFVIVDVRRLKRYLRFNKDKFNESTKISLGGEDNPARGFLLMADDVKDLLTNELYD